MVETVPGSLNKATSGRMKLGGLYLLAGLTAVVLIASMYYVFRTGSRMAATYAPQIDAAMEIKLEVTRAHLWFEEIISGDRQEDMADVWKFLDNADWYTRALLEGGENQEGLFVPLTDDKLRQAVSLVREDLGEFKAMTQQRHEDSSASESGSKIDQQYDALYRRVMIDVDDMETSLQNTIANNLKKFRGIQIALIGLSVLLVAVVAVSFRFFINRHLNDEERLRASNQQLQAGEQQLRAANQQLQAGEQQLRATNQQLQANEQQLRAANQQLLAGEQQLRAANQQLQAREREYRLLFEEMTSGLAVHEIICDDEGQPHDYRFLDTNPTFEKLTGMQNDKIIGKTIREIMPTIDDFWIETYGKVALTGEPGRFEHYSKELDKHFDVAAYRPVEGHFAVVFNDVTTRKRAEKKLGRLNKTLSIKNKELQSIVYAASHDLRSPLVNIQGFGGELLDHCENLRKMIKNGNVSKELKNEVENLIDEDIPEALDFIQAGTGKMQTLLDGLLSVSRIGSIDINVQTLDMKELLQSVIAATQFQIDELGVSIELQDVPDCRGDKNQINQVFSNLLNNALKYLSPDRKGEICISGCIQDARAVYCIQDNGIGIAPEHQEKVFEIFHRLNPKNSPEGEGLGLTIISRILDRLDGRIWVESEPDKGSKFFVSLPKA